MRKEMINGKRRNTRLYQIWADMKHRCYNTNNKYYKYYGAKSIEVYNEWKDNFELFYKWCLENGYNTNLTLDRIDNNGNYGPDNCRWVDKVIQARNTRKQLNNKSGYIGVSKSRGKYQSCLSVNGKTIYLGVFEDPKSAALARDNYIIENKTNHTLNFSKKVSNV